MSKSVHSNKRIFPALLAGVLVGLVSMLLVVHTAWAAPAQQDAAPTSMSKECSACHPNVSAAWADSKHAHSFDNATFVDRWKSLGEPGDCLLCHTTGYQATTGKYQAASITCEACHGNVVAGHPPAVMPVRSDTEYCGTCHTITLGEWRLTGHAAAGVGCTACHNPHSQKARFENPDEMCLNCHKNDLGEHQNDTHIQKGIRCIECHALVIPSETPPIDGLAPTGHSFTITPATCVACHTDTLHIGKPIPGYEAGAKAVSASLPVSPTLPSLVAEYTGTAGAAVKPDQQIQTLQAALASTRLSSLFQGGLVGLALGGSTFYLIARNQRQTRKEEIEKTGEEGATKEIDEMEQDHE